MLRRFLKNEIDTKALSVEIARRLLGGQTLGLVGELGAGKTTFVRYLISALGGDENQVASPTYTLQHEYNVRDGLIVEHWDLYRLSVLPEELFEPQAPSTIRVLEWADKASSILASIDLILEIKVRHNEEREVFVANCVRP